MKRILAINPGSTSTKVGVFEDQELKIEQTLRHDNDKIASFSRIPDQLEFRSEVILAFLLENNLDVKDFDIIVGRGGLLKPIVGGTYKVNDLMVHDLENATMEHASNLGGIIANNLAKQAGVNAYIVDPVVVDEMEDIARVSGHADFERLSIFHALNQKAVAKQVAKDMDKKYEELNLIVTHLGGGVSVGAHKQGRVVDVNNALDGEGPFSPERSGTLPVAQVYKMAFSGEVSLDEMKKMNVGNGGLVSHLGTNDTLEVTKRIEAGDEKAEFILRAMAYQVAKEIGSCAAVLKGEIDGIVLTGGIAYSEMLTNWIKEYISFIAPVLVYPGEDELSALASGALRVELGEEDVQEYV